MIQVTVNDADRLTGAQALIQLLMNRVAELEVNLAALKRTLVEREAADAAKEASHAGDHKEGQRPPSVQGGGEGHGEGRRVQHDKG